jgi:peptidoglycan/xylan/chitin deacetylase (PgdA/CDA1 family)
MKKIMLTFDVEEFDLPREYGLEIKDEEMYKISFDGLKNLLKILNVRSTFFVTANFAKKYPELIKGISEKHEIGLHGDEHKDNYLELNEEEVEKKLKKSKSEIEKITGKKIKGFRAPRLQFDKYRVLKKLEIEYDSSYIPSYMPGRYNNIFGTRKRFIKENVKVIPLSVIPVLRIPMAWYVFRNLGLKFGKFGTKLNKEICLVFHPWEFTDLSKFNVLKLIKRNTGSKMLKMLKDYINWGESRYDFVGMDE